MSKTRYLLAIPAEDYDKVIRDADKRGVSIAHWLREAIKIRLKYIETISTSSPRK